MKNLLITLCVITIGYSQNLKAKIVKESIDEATKFVLEKPVAEKESNRGLASGVKNSKLKNTTPEGEVRYWKYSEETEQDSSAKD